jgi:hypothetical protein
MQVEEQEVRQLIAVPNGQEDEDTMEEQQVEEVQNGLEQEQEQLDLCLCLCLFLFLFLFLSLYLAVEMEEVQQAAEPNEQADDYTEEEEEEMDCHYSHSVAAVVEVAA